MTHDESGATGVTPKDILQADALEPAWTQIPLSATQEERDIWVYTCRWYMLNTGYALYNGT